MTDPFVAAALTLLAPFAIFLVARLVTAAYFKSKQQYENTQGRTEDGTQPTRQ